MKTFKLSTISSILSLAFGLLLIFYSPIHQYSSLFITKDASLSVSVSVFHNLNYSEIFKHEMEEGDPIASNGVVAINTGKFTGRSPKDKYIVKQDPSQHFIWWGPVNKPISPEIYDRLYNQITSYFSNVAKKIYVFDGYSGANPETQIRVRFITEFAWQHHFVTNMFIRPNATSLKSFVPDFTIINACNIVNNEWEKDLLNSEVFIIFNIEKKTAIIGGTLYSGEMKKGIFSVMNYILPFKGIMTMHCSANVDDDGNVALFFGLSGTGKTTLSADPTRYLIGDDEHGWDDNGVFNLEGGCYAKTIHLSEASEPYIYRAIKRDALLENVYMDPVTKELDYFDMRNTENSRVSYPIYHIPNYHKSGMAGHPKNIIFLTADAFGVFPPVSRLNVGQAIYHFLSGYTAKVAGTERGVHEPQATFSACFGDPFLPLHPTKYADLLLDKLQKHKTHVFLVNTGWTGGPYGVGKRMRIDTTRSCICAILSGKIHESTFFKDEVFGIEIPYTLDGVDTRLLHPRNTWNDTSAYDYTRIKLASMFIQNYKQYISSEYTDFSIYGPFLE